VYYVDLRKIIVHYYQSCHNKAVLLKHSSGFLFLSAFIMSSNKLRTSRVHAAYILFGKPHTRENEEECPLKLDNIGHGLTLCHYENPERPVLVTYIYLNKHSSHYTEYPIENNLGVSRDDSSRSLLPNTSSCVSSILVYLLYLMQQR
jgi:hypothetical protein